METLIGLKGAKIERDEHLLMNIYAIRRRYFDRMFSR